MQVYAWMEFSALDLWASEIEVFHSPPNQANKARDLGELQGNLSQRTSPSMRSQIPTTHINLEKANIDHVSSNVKPSGSSAMFSMSFAVVNIIIKGRNFHRVAKDMWTGLT